MRPLKKQSSAGQNPRNAQSGYQHGLPPLLIYQSESYSKSGEGDLIKFKVISFVRVYWDIDINGLMWGDPDFDGFIYH